ncbi:hypothetical protein HSB1_04550 [Halogranum salarium B-1]|uniref:Uncharacterized protein n=1 Tax=Halogranum salarium B-1 TaxID=1210908 RepID=J3JHY9_9EURY|nr:hypothetical protein HSB1_04550 [Halogranum salarium B-1]
MKAGRFREGRKVRKSKSQKVKRSHGSTGSTVEDRASRYWML